MSDITTPSAPPVPEPTPYAAPAPPPAKRSALPLWALVVSIVAIVSAIIPGLSFVAWLPAIAATILGIIGLVSKAAGRGKALTAVILGPITLIVAIAVSFGTVAAGIAGAAPSVGTDSDTSEVAVTEPTADDEVVVDEPVVDVVPEDAVYSGKGDSIIKITLPDGVDQVAVATLTHKGSRNFAVWALDDAMNQQDLIVNEIGRYGGTVAFNLDGSGISSLEITADGPWTVTVKSLQKLRSFGTEPITGTGDDVFFYGGDAGAATISHKGSSNFAIWTYGDSSDLVVNEIGTYSGTVRWSGRSLVVLTADGTWSISVD